MIGRIQSFVNDCRLILNIARVINATLDDYEARNGTYVFTMRRESIDKDHKINVFSLVKTKPMNASKEVAEVIRSVREEFANKES